MARVSASCAAGQWEARGGITLVGVAGTHQRPDGRTYAQFVDCRSDAFGPLTQMQGDAERDIYTVASDHQDGALQPLLAAGFVINRQEHQYRISTDGTVLRLADPGPPPGVDLISAADADLERLRRLDDAIRQDIPGSTGWRWSPEEFREETFADGFDPRAYQVAVDGRAGAYVGLMRVWIKESGPRFGCLGVLRQLRRSRVAYALVAAVMGELRRLGFQTWRPRSTRPTGPPTRSPPESAPYASANATSWSSECR